MPQFDVHLTPDGQDYLIDCQSDLLSRLRTRFVVPLIPPNVLLPVRGRFNPVFEVRGTRLALAPQGARTVLARELGAVIASLREHDLAITSAIDMLVSGI